MPSSPGFDGVCSHLDSPGAPRFDVRSKDDNYVMRCQRLPRRSVDVSLPASACLPWANGQSGRLPRTWDVADPRMNMSWQTRNPEILDSRNPPVHESCVSTHTRIQQSSNPRMQLSQDPRMALIAAILSSRHPHIHGSASPRVLVSHDPRMASTSGWLIRGLMTSLWIPGSCPSFKAQQRQYCGILGSVQSTGVSGGRWPVCRWRAGQQNRSDHGGPVIASIRAAVP